MGVRLAKVDEVKAGEKAAKDVLDGRGNLLFKAGVELTPRLIDILKSRNLTHVFIEASDGGLTEAELAARRAQIEVETDLMFADVKDHPLMARLLEAVKKHIRSQGV